MLPVDDFIGQSITPQITPPEKQEKFTEKMNEIAMKEREREAQAKARQLGYQYIDLKGFPVSPETLGMISEAEAEELKVVCFLYTGEEIRLASTDPANPAVAKLSQDLVKRYHAHSELYFISERSFETVKKLYKTIPKIKFVPKGIEITAHDLSRFQEKLGGFEDLHREIQEVSITEMLTMIMAAAIKARSSDVHIEAAEQDIKVRFRIDGMLHDVATLPQEAWRRIISRVKILAGLKINIDDRPQDGRFTIDLEEEKIDVRVSTLPTSFGESIVMRLLMSSAVQLRFEDLGLRGRAYEQLAREIKRPNGMIITTGPTGSGKTTSLYAILLKLNKPETKIVTIEDPIEYKLEGISQSQVKGVKIESLTTGRAVQSKIDTYTFASGLRSILRQDPDIIMVGEIRDIETAEIAIQAALTGHLVLSTIHTNDAAGTVPRFLSMGVKPFLLAPALNAMIGQRLVRRLCQDCKEEVILDEATQARVEEILEKLPADSGYEINLAQMKFYQAKGCEKCNKLGYHGRIGIYEIMTMNQEIEELVLGGEVSEYKMREVAVKQGMITMVQDGLLKAAEGITSVEEIFRVAE